MRNSVKVFMQIALISFLIVLTSAQSRYGNQRKKASKEAVGQGRTFGLIEPLLGLGLSSIVRPLVGYDAPIVTNIPQRPSLSTGTAQSDPYYGNYGYGNYGGYIPNYYNGYNNYFGLRPLYRPIYGGYINHFYGGYRPQIYPTNYGSYPQYNVYGGQRPFYNNAGSRPIAQRPVTAPAAATYPSIPTASQTTSGAANPAINSGQASQIANILGQLLGQQLRPLLNQGAASTAHDDTDYFEGRRYKDRRYQR